MRVFRANEQPLTAIFAFGNDGVNGLFAKKIGNHLTVANGIIRTFNRRKRKVIKRQFLALYFWSALFCRF